MSKQNPVFPKPVAEDEDGWDLQQRNVEEQIENALVRPTLGDGENRVETFKDDADIEKHMLSADHGKYGLDTHTYRFSVTAQRQFWRWHFQNEERIRQERLAEHERKTAEFNRRINTRRATVDAAKPAVELVDDPVDMGDKWGQRVRMQIGSGPGPLNYWWLGYRPAHNRHMGIEGYSKWREDRSAHQLPHVWAVTGLHKGVEYDFAVIGGCSHGSVASDHVSASFEQGAQQEQETTKPPAPQQQAQPESEPELSLEPKPEPKPEVIGHRLSGTWGLAWGRFPGIAPGRNYGKIKDDLFQIPNGQTAQVTAFFLTDMHTLRVTLTPDTPADQFPVRVHVESNGHVNVFGSPGDAQTFGLGEARDYRLESGSPGYISSGVQSGFILEH